MKCIKEKTFTIRHIKTTLSTNVKFADKTHLVLTDNLRKKMTWQLVV